MARLLTIVAVLVGFLSTAALVLQRNLESFYIFQPEQLHALTRRSIAAHGNDTRAIVGSIVSALRESHAPYIATREDWFMNNAGGAMGGVYIIHASVTEYLIIFGTAIGTEGHTGRHTADDYFHVLTGEQWAYTAGSYEPEVYGPGSQHHLRWGQAKQYKMPHDCFALEYARGWIPPMMAFGFADGFSSTLDVPTLWATVTVTAREILGNLARGKF